MDEWFELIVTALKTKEAHPDERCRALIRAGQIAQAYFGSKELTEVFGSVPASALLYDGNNSHTGARGSSSSTTGQENRPPAVASNV
jgi:hypothetical protein